MGDFIQRDPVTGVGARVTDAGRAKGFVISESEIEHFADEFGTAFSWKNIPFATTKEDTILLVKNTSTDKLLRISAVTASANTATEMIIHCPVVPTPTGTTLDAVSLNRDNIKVAEATAISDETTNTIVQNRVVYRGIVGADAPVKAIERVGVILGTDDSIAVDFVQAVTTGDVVIEGFFATESQLGL